MIISGGLSEFIDINETSTWSILAVYIIVATCISNYLCYYYMGQAYSWIVMKIPKWSENYYRNMSRIYTCTCL